MEFERVNQKVIYEHLKNGLDVIIIPKKGATNYYASYSTHFGSLNYKFKAPGNTEVTTVPDGVAHFLEHKMFEEADGINALDKLSKIGADANAYTSFNHTSYLFSCNSRFDEAFDILLKFVQSPYYTEENVEKEKGIIGQEIKMYDDDPQWQVFFQLLLAMYGENHAVTKDIAGTVESISHITPEILYDCYNTFYDPSNMVIVVSGDVEPNHILEMIKDKVKDQEEKTEIERYYGEINPGVVKSRVEKQMDVSIPIAILGFKDSKAQRLRKAGLSEENRDLVKRSVAVEILLSLLSGKSSRVFEELYNDGTITSPISADFTFEEDYAYSNFNFECNEVDKVVDRIKKEIIYLKENGIDKKEFDRIKKMLYGGFVGVFNDSTAIARNMTADYFKGINTLDFADAYKDIDIEYVEEVLKDHFDFDNMALSVINPN